MIPLGRESFISGIDEQSSQVYVPMLAGGAINSEDGKENIAPARTSLGNFRYGPVHWKVPGRLRFWRLMIQSSRLFLFFTFHLFVKKETLIFLVTILLPGLCPNWPVTMTTKGPTKTASTQESAPSSPFHTTTTFASESSSTYVFIVCFEILEIFMTAFRRGDDK